MPPTLLPVTIDQLRLCELNEGFRYAPYVDTVGKLTIGMGRNLTDVGITREEAAFLARNDLVRAQQALVELDPWVLTLDPVRRAAFADLIFNLGKAGYMSFRKARAAAGTGDFEGCVRELVDSKWYTQVGVRGPRLCRMIITGKWPWES